MEKIFFGYASRPEVRRQTLAAAAKKLQSLNLYDVVNWENLKVGGRIIINTILGEIQAARLCIFDVSSLNQNVLFEIGYAIGAEKRIWFLLDKTDPQALTDWEQLRTLTTIGYIGYSNSDEVRAAFLKENPPLQSDTVFEQVIQNALHPAESPIVLYLPSAHETDAGRQISRVVFREAGNRGLPVVATDPEEGLFFSLPWYAQHIYSSTGVLVHFIANWRRNAPTYNARQSLVAGLALGMDRPVFMLAEEDYASPIDYRDYLHVYANVRSATEKTAGWFEATLSDRDGPAAAERKLRLETELKSIRFGEPVAENEEEQLSKYFVETGSFLQVLEDRVTVFLGRKGTGKTANFFEAAQRLRDDARNFVSVIKPYSYELQGLLRVLGEFPEQEVQSYLTEALWKFLLYSQIAVRVGDAIRRRPSQAIYGTAGDELLKFLDRPGNPISEPDFAVRLEKTVGALHRNRDAGVTDAKRSISEAMHQSLLRELRLLIKRAVGKQRIAILIDNLDKAWDQSADLEALSHLLLGLLVATGAVRRDFQRQESGSQGVSVSLALFLRTDIYAHVASVAREPDKIPTTTIEWKNRELLFRIIEERYAAGRENAAGSELWDRFVARTIHEQPTRDYVASRLLARPRDVVYFFNEAIFEAVNAGHGRVLEADVDRAMSTYSRFAFDALLVEHGLATTDLEAVLIEFAGAPSVMELDEAVHRIQASGTEEQAVDEIFRRLRMLAFFGIEVADHDFSFRESLQAVSIDDAKARQRSRATGKPVRVKVHPAYHSYLGVQS